MPKQSGTASKETGVWIDLDGLLPEHREKLYQLLDSFLPSGTQYVVEVRELTFFRSEKP